MSEQPWTQSQVLVTGATGMVGSNLVSKLLRLGANITCLVRDHDESSPLWTSGNIKRVRIVSGRLECFDHVRTALVEHDIDTVFHLGAQALVGAGQRDPLGTFESNIRGTYNLLEACRLHGASFLRRIVIASSDKAYGEAERLPYTERTPLAAKNPYDVSKCCADLIAQSYYHSHRLPIGIARCGNIFGPGDLNWSRIVPGTIRSLILGQSPVIRSDGTPLRDYLFVNDAVAGYLAIAQWLDEPETIHEQERAFNFSPENPISVLDMTHRIQQAIGRTDLKPVIENTSRGEISNQHLDSTRARSMLDWAAKTDIDEALRETVGWYRGYLSRSAAEIECKPEATVAGVVS